MWVFIIFYIKFQFASFLRHLCDVCDVCRYLLVQLEDLHNCDDAKGYISHLKFRDVCVQYIVLYTHAHSHTHSPQAESSMIKYGKLLLTELPDDTTSLLQNLCTDWLPRGQQPKSGTPCRNGTETVECVECDLQETWYLIGQIRLCISSCL